MSSTLEWKSNHWQHFKHTLHTLLHRYLFVLHMMRARNENTYKFLYGKRTLKARRPYADRTFRTRYQHTEGSLWNWHILCPPTSAYCGRSVSVRLLCRGRVERSLNVCIACLLRTGHTPPAYAENFCVCIKFSAYGTSSDVKCVWQRALNVRSTSSRRAADVHQRTTKSRHTQSSYATMWQPL